jgi:hypothetical protein
MDILLLVIHGLIAIAVLRALVRGGRSLLVLVAFLLPLSGLTYTAGVNWNWTRLLGPILAFGMLIHGTFPRVLRLPGLRWLGAFLLYAAAISFFFWQLYPDILPLIERARLIGWGRGQTELRYVVQYTVLAFNWCFLLGAMAFTRSTDDRDAAIQAFINGCLLSVIVGLYQAVAQANGLPWITPKEELAGFLGSRRVINTYDIAAGFKMSRLFGLGGEPKHTAAFVAVALAGLLSFALYDRNTRVSRVKITILLVGLVLTLSTSGMVAFLLICGLMLRSRELLVSQNAGAAIGALVLLGTLLLGLTLILGEKTTTELVDSRLSTRLTGGFDTIRRYEGKDAAALELMWDEPERVLLGHGSGGVDFHLIDRVSVVEREKQSMITPTYLIIRLVAEYGLIGLVFVFSLGLTWTRRIRHESRASLRIYFLALLTAVLIQPTFIYPCVLFLVGTGLGALNSTSAASADPVQPAR